MNSKYPPEKTVSLRSRESSSSVLIISIIVILSALNLYLVYLFIEKISALSEQQIVTTSNISNHDQIQLEVLNGCGIDGVAEEYTEYLRSKNFDVVNMGNYFSYDVDYSLVIDRTGNLNSAKGVAEALGIESNKIAQQINDDYLLDVTVIIGKDFNQLKPKN